MKEIEEILIKFIDESEEYISLLKKDFPKLEEKLQKLIEFKEKEAFEAGRERSYYNNGLFTSDWYNIYETFEDYKKGS